MTRKRTCTKPPPQYRGRDCSKFGPPTEVNNCYPKSCPIDGNYTPWSNFSSCSKTCGTGTRNRTRYCTNPTPKFGGLSCSRLGPSEDVEQCTTRYCPINGGYTNWSELSKCTVSCGNGTRQRTRTCSNPQPNYGGKNCSHLGPRVDVESCNSHPCPIHGGYTSWSDFSNCTKTCDNGTRQRTRNCTNPEPRFGGRNCSHFGPAVVVTRCNAHPCPIHGDYSQWSNFSTCSRSCGNGTTRRTRNCTNPAPKYGGKNCSHLGRKEETRRCNTHSCPIHGGFTSWSEFSACTKSCGDGEAKRTRNCTNPEPKFGGRDCSHLGVEVELKVCNIFPCPIHGGYGPWSNFSECSETCGNGTQQRTRNCSDPAPEFSGRNCSRLGPSLEVLPCYTMHCPINGGYSSWSNFSLCTKSCGSGIMTRWRNCTNPVPRYGGRNCSLLGKESDVRGCNLFPCAIDGGYTLWSTFSDCSRSCGNGTRERTRNCTNPAPKFGGKDCSHAGPTVQIEFCNTHPCPIHGGYTSWSNFTLCTRSCGNGTKIRTRNCTNPVPRYRGLNCTRLGPQKEMRYCNQHPCPIDGGYTAWSEFSECSRSCGNGTKTRRRNCTNPSPKFGGKNCSRFGAAEDRLDCSLRPCPIHGGYGNWSNFTECTKSCGNGTRERVRVCDNPAPQHDGMTCAILGPSRDLEKCNDFPCPIHGNYSEWTEYKPCTVTCAGGHHIRRRYCTSPPPAHGGRDCTLLGPAVQKVVCNTQDCPGKLMFVILIYELCAFGRNILIILIIQE